MRKGLIYAIPDPQVKPGIRLDYLRAIGLHIMDKRPETVVCLGDFADMPSLSSYDKGKKSFEGRRYRKDIEAAHRGMEVLLGPLRAANLEGAEYRPRLVMLMGNHEARIDRATEEAPELEGTISTDDLRYVHYGWEVYPFLTPVNIGGVLFCHYLTSGVMGRPITTAQALLTKRHMSCVVGHQQGLMLASAVRGDGRQLQAVIAGSSYLHDEPYLGPQGNAGHWRGVVLLHDVKDGEFVVNPVSTQHLIRKYREDL